MVVHYSEDDDWPIYDEENIRPIYISGNNETHWYVHSFIYLENVAHILIVFFSDSSRYPDSDLLGSNLILMVDFTMKKTCLKDGDFQFAM